MNFYVYITTNLINGKQYIGDHKINKYDNQYFGSGRYFRLALKKYRRKNFKKQILEYFETKEEAFESQEKYIKQYNTLFPNGYNLSPKGGAGVPGFYSEEGIIKLKKSLTGRKLSEEHKLNLSKSRRGRTYRSGYKLSIETKIKIGKGNKGKKISDETKKKISLSCKGKIPWNKGKKNVYSKETLIKMRHHKNIGSKRKRIMCEFCNKEIAINIYNQYHGKTIKNMSLNHKIMFNLLNNKQ